MNQDELLTRGIERVYPTPEELAQELASGRKLKMYFGIDPTGPALHIGHAASLLKLKDFQDLGHHIILLIGDFTAMIGDPTDKSSARVVLSAEQVKDNMKNYLDQAGKILNLDQTEVRYNSEWLSNLSSAELIKLASRVTYAQMIKRDMFQRRLEENKDLFLNEFLYPLLQGYDSVALDVDLELGGNDQIYNMLVGRDLMKSLKNKRKFVIATKLLVDPTGKKMGKSEGNMVTLTDPANEMYGKVMSWPDSLVPLAVEICTRLPLAELTGQIKRDPKQAKMKLAREIVRLYHSAAAVEEAEACFINTFQKKEIPNLIEEVNVAPQALLVEALLAANLIKSKSEFRRLLDEGAIHNLETDKLVTDPAISVTKPTRFRVGKKRFVKIVPR